eukprot:4008585-Pleurochrysis_carterae.AAC.2
MTCPQDISTSCSQASVTHVVNCAAASCSDHHPDKFTYMRLYLKVTNCAIVKSCIRDAVIENVQGGFVGEQPRFVFSWCLWLCGALWPAAAAVGLAGECDGAEVLTKGFVRKGSAEIKGVLAGMGRRDWTQIEKLLNRAGCEAAISHDSMREDISTAFYDALEFIHAAIEDKGASAPLQLLHPASTALLPIPLLPLPSPHPLFRFLPLLATRFLPKAFRLLRPS